MTVRFGFVRLVQALVVLTALLLDASSAVAQPYPSGPVRIVVPFPPGAVADTLARFLAERLHQRLGQPFVVDNRTGAGGNLGAALVAKAPADGQTLLWTYDGTLIFNPLLTKNLPFDVEKDFAPVATVGYINLVLAVPSSLGVNNFKELVAYARANPGKLSFGSNGAGGQAHLMGEMFKKGAQADVAHVPYKGTGQALTDLLAGRLLFGIAGISSIDAYVKDGRLKPLAISGDQRSPLMPDVPTFAEVGFKEMDMGAWHAIVAPARTPAAIVARLNEAINALLSEPAVEREFLARGVLPMKKAPDEFATFMRQESHRIANVIRTANVSIE